MNSITFDEAWDALLRRGVTEQALQLVVAINGKSVETLQDVLYAHAGYRAFDQLDGDSE